jgi:hypothetical protein
MRENDEGKIRAASDGSGGWVYDLDEDYFGQRGSLMDFCTG